MFSSRNLSNGSEMDVGFESWDFPVSFTDSRISRFDVSRSFELLLYFFRFDYLFVFYGDVIGRVMLI